MFKGGEASSQLQEFETAKIETQFFALILRLQLQRYLTNTKRYPPKKFLETPNLSSQPELQGKKRDRIMVFLNLAEKYSQKIIGKKNIFQNVLFLVLAFVRNHTYQNEHLLEITFSRKLFSRFYTSQNLHLAEITFPLKLIFQILHWPDLHLAEITFFRKLIFQDLHLAKNLFS